ncbi:MAG: RNHCP domain-containing protein [Candidatus Moranbacteria bacterium]|nr:RNHCP domain-containing protein [Candidatus Moranbacteria bacterium]
MSIGMAFIRKKESFDCLRCGQRIKGNGYTNHCPKCLWSRHVDVSPGDRLASCGGLMEPVAYSVKAGEERLLHRCVLCGFERENRISEEDDRDAVIDVMENVSDTLFRG